MYASSPFSCSTDELKVHRTVTYLPILDSKVILADSLSVIGSTDSLNSLHAPTNGVGVIVGVAIGSGGGA